MQEMFPEQEPQNNNKSFMERVGWQLVVIAVSFVAGILGTIIVAIWQGTTHIIDFNWFVVIMVVIMLAIMGFCIWYTFRTKQKFQEQYDRDRANLLADYQQFKQNWQAYFANERDRWDKWAISYSQDRAKEYKEHSEELKRQCMDAISDAENRMDSSIKNAQTIFTGAVESQRRAVNTYGEQLIHAQKQMKELEQRLRKELSLSDEETLTPP